MSDKELKELVNELLKRIKVIEEYLGIKPD